METVLSLDSAPESLLVHSSQEETELNNERGAILGEVISEVLNPREIFVIFSRYYEERTYREISEILGVSLARANQIGHKALFKLRRDGGRLLKKCDL